jgi:hypothetical protein
MKLAIITLMLASALPASAQKKPETSHLVFVTEYVRELAAIENIRESGEEGLKENTNGDIGTMSNTIYVSSSFQLELGSQIGMLKSMRLNPPFEDVIPNFIVAYGHKIALWKRLGEISSAFMSGPKPGVDYAQLSTEIPQIRGQLDYIDKALLEASALVFETLIDMKPDSNNHTSHLLITNAEKAKLLDIIDINFGSKLDQKHQNFVVGAASVLKTGLNKDFKSSDDPWE